MKRRVLGLFLAIGILTQLLPTALPALAADSASAQPQVVALSNNTELTTTKALSFDEAKGEYLLDLRVLAENTMNENEENRPKPQVIYDNGSKGKAPAVAVTHDGRYLFQVWGGDGNGASYGTAGGDGTDRYGVGGYVYGYIELSGASKSLEISLGANGAKNGDGGEGTIVKVSKGNVTLLAAGGGGGTKNANERGENGLTGPDDPLTVINKNQSFDGQGHNGQGTGKAGPNYRNIDPADGFVVLYKPEEDADLSPEAKKAVEAAKVPIRPGKVDGQEVPKTGGLVIITCIQMDGTGVAGGEQHMDRVREFTATATISPYFTCAEVRTIDHLAPDSMAEPDVTFLPNDDGSIAVDVTDSNNAVAQEAGDGTITMQSDFTIQFVLKPKDGFLGGNSVPLLWSEVPFTLGQGSIPETLTIAPSANTDYANVAVPAAAETLFITHNNQLLKPGDTLPQTALYTLYIDGLEPWKTEFVTIGGPLIWEGETAIPSVDLLKPTETTTYSVELTITPKGVPAEVGKADPKNVRKPAVVTVAEAAVIEIEITWGALEFEYSRIWDPELHAYVPRIAAVSEGNWVTIKNVNGELAGDVDPEPGVHVEVEVTFAYTPEVGYEALLPRFTTDQAGEGPLSSPLAIPPGEEKSVWLWLDGELPEGTPSGICGQWHVYIDPPPTKLTAHPPEGGDTL